MANPPTPKTTLLTEAIAFGKTQAETPYENLLGAAAEAGWGVRLTQRGEPVAHSNGLLVSFDVLLNKDDGPYERVEMVSMNVSLNTLDVSLAARLGTMRSLIYMFFGRLPPAAPVQAAATAPQRPAPVANGHDTDEEDAQPMREDEGTTAVEVVKSRTPDGLPVFVDLFEIGMPGNIVAASVLDEIADVLPSVNSTAALNALMSVNPDLIPFFSDLAAPSQRKELKDMLDARKAALTASSDVAPRRRSAAAAN